MRIDEELVHYTIASTIFITLYPYIFIYCGYQNLTPEEKELYQTQFTRLMFLLPIMFGMIFALSYKCMGFIPRKVKNIYIRFIVAGAWTGFLISLILHYIFHVQDRWLKMESPEICHVLTPIFYFILFYTLGVWMRQQILYGPQATASPPVSPATSLLQKVKTSTSQNNAQGSAYDKLAQMAQAKQQ